MRWLQEERGRVKREYKENMKRRIQMVVIWQTKQGHGGRRLYRQVVTEGRLGRNAYRDRQ